MSRRLDQFCVRFTKAAKENNNEVLKEMLPCPAEGMSITEICEVLTYQDEDGNMPIFYITLNENTEMLEHYLHLAKEEYIREAIGSSLITNLNKENSALFMISCLSGNTSAIKTIYNYIKDFSINDCSNLDLAQFLKTNDQGRSFIDYLLEHIDVLKEQTRNIKK
ncbi:hypothetical protein HGB13_03300 [bacterium]|nr:hypothetical protein [bacterium]